MVLGIGVTEILSDLEPSLNLETNIKLNSSTIDEC